jgi:hypothetical protein
MNHWTRLIFTAGPMLGALVLLGLQLYTYRRTRHYSLALLVAGGVMGLLATALLRILNSESFAPSLTTLIIDGAAVLYVGSLTVGTWGAAALFQSYCRLTDVQKPPPKTG